MNSVVHFEMPAEDIKRMANFYSSVFGWKTQQMGEEMGNYVVASTTEAGEDGRPKTPGALNGGFYPKRAEDTNDCPSVVIATENLQQSMRKVVAAGGKLLGEPMDIPGVGSFISFFDTEGNRVRLLQPLMR